MLVPMLMLAHGYEQNRGPALLEPMYLLRAGSGVWGGVGDRDSEQGK